MIDGVWEYVFIRCCWFFQAWYLRVVTQRMIFPPVFTKKFKPKFWKLFFPWALLYIYNEAILLIKKLLLISFKDQYRNKLKPHESQQILSNSSVVSYLSQRLNSCSPINVSYNSRNVLGLKTSWKGIIQSFEKNTNLAVKFAGPGSRKLRIAFEKTEIKINSIDRIVEQILLSVGIFYYRL